jgi:hypothetical protein
MVTVGIPCLLANEHRDGCRLALASHEGGRWRPVLDERGEPTGLLVVRAESVIA